MRTLALSLLLTAVLWLVPLAGPAQEAATPAPPPIKDGDVVVFVGDEVTGQQLYPRYLEAALRAAYPKVAFTTSILAKDGATYKYWTEQFDAIAAAKPTLLIIMLGLHDEATGTWDGTPFNQQSAPAAFLTKARALGTRVMLCTPVPVVASAGDGKNLERYAKSLVGWAQAEKMPVADLYTPLATIWQGNFARERVARLRAGIVPFLDDKQPFDEARGKAMVEMLKPLFAEPMKEAPEAGKLAAHYTLSANGGLNERKAMRDYLAGWVKTVDKADPPFVAIASQVNGKWEGRRPGPAGQLMIAALLANALNIDTLVSDALIDGSGAKARLLIATRAKVRDLTVRDGVVSFKRLDEALPFPIPAEARPALAVGGDTPQGSPLYLFGASYYMLLMPGMPPGQYRLAIDGIPLATVTGEELAEGINLGLLEKGQIADQCARLLAAVMKGDAAAAAQAAHPIEHTWTITPVK